MNLMFIKRHFGGVLLMLLFTGGICLPASGQVEGAYKRMVTAVNTAVTDTVSGLNLSIYKVSPLAKHGVLSIITVSSGGSGNPYVYAIRYNPNAGFTGVDTFTLEYNYTNTYPYLTYQAYQVSVYPSIIKTKTDYAVTSAGSVVTIDVLGNDVSSHGPLTLSSIPLSDNGTASINGANQIEFTPNPGFTGVAHVNYVVCDALYQCKTSEVNIGVHPTGLPTSDSLRIATPKNTQVAIPLLYEGFTVFQAPSQGILTLSSAGSSFIYVPGPGFTGTDQFTLTCNYGGVDFTKTVSVQVLNVPTPNTMAIDDYVYTPKGQPVTFNVRANDIGNLMVKSWSIPANLPGTVTNTSGNGTVTFTPNPDFTGTATFFYKIGNSYIPNLEAATVRVMVSNLNPNLATFHLTTPQSTALVVNYKIPFTGFSFNIQNQPDHGVCMFYPGFTTHTLSGQTVSGYNLLIYTPEAGYSGSDEFEMTYCVSANGQCQDVKIQVDVVEPLAQADPYCEGDCVWTGDVNADGIVNNKDLLPLGYNMGAQGPMRINGALEWFGQHADNWNNPYTGSPIDLKHADTDGNGFISTDDTVAINLFYGQTHNLIPAYPPPGKGLPFTMKLLTPNPGIGDLVRVEVSLGTMANPVANAYGFTFDASISKHIKASGLHMIYYNNSWLDLNAPNLWMSETPNPNRLETAFTRSNGVAVSGGGPIGEYDFIIIDIVIGGKPGEPSYAVVEMTTPTIMWSDGRSTTGDKITLEIPIRSESVPGKPVDESNLFVYPSPAGETIQIHLNGDDFIHSLNIFDLHGKMVYASGTGQWEHTGVDVRNFPSGCYVASVTTSGGVLQKKFQVMR
jgi:heme/copper-type cytochrome/quinol oxidase subunit 2